MDQYRAILSDNSNVIERIEHDIPRLDETIALSAPNQINEAWKQLSRQINRLLTVAKDQAHEAPYINKFGGIFNWLRIAHGLMNLLNDCIKTGKSTGDLAKMVEVLTRAINGAFKVLNYRLDRSSESNLSSEIFKGPQSYMEMESLASQLYVEIGEDLTLFLVGYKAQYWMPSKARRLSAIITRTMVWELDGFLEFCRAIRSAHCAEAIYRYLHVKSNVNIIRQIFSIIDQRWYTWVGDWDIPFLSTQPSICKTILIPRQREWLLLVDGKDVKVVHQSTENWEHDDPIDNRPFLDTSSLRHKDQVRCRLIYHCPHASHNPSRLVILHCHAGGMIAGKPDSQVFLEFSWNSQSESDN